MLLVKAGDDRGFEAFGKDDSGGKRGHGDGEAGECGGEGGCGQNADRIHKDADYGVGL